MMRDIRNNPSAMRLACVMDSRLFCFHPPAFCQPVAGNSHAYIYQDVTNQTALGGSVRMLHIDLHSNVKGRGPVSTSADLILSSVLHK